MDDMDDIIKEFLVESYEYLNSLDTDLVELEKNSSDPELLNRIFRSVHTIKGTSGFLGYNKLVSITHAGEGLLDLLRKGRLVPDEALTSALLQLVDAIRQILESIEATRKEGNADHSALSETLSRLQDKEVASVVPAENPGTSAALPVEPAPASADSAPDEVAAVNTDADPTSSGSKAFAQLQTLETLRGLCEQTGQSIPLAQLAEKCDLKKDTVHNHLAALRKEGLVRMRKNNTYEPATNADALSTGTLRNGVEASTASPSQAIPKVPGPAQDSPSAVMSEGMPETRETPKASFSDNTIRVDVELLDTLMNLVGELVLTRNQIVQFTTAQRDTAFVASAQHLNLITTELQEGVMKTRMQPIGNIWNKFPRVVRDIAVACNKKARVEMEGADTELDKTIIEAIKDPLTHLVRNAIDHGIETPEVRAACGKPAEGRLLLRAFHEGGQVNIEIIDDGGGINPERIKQKAIERGMITQPDAARMSDREILHMVFMPGFSTAKEVSNISGRGVGMDVVKTNIEKIGGTVDVQSKLGHGTSIKIKIPLTLAIIPALIIRMGEDRYAIPQVNLLELVRLEGEQIKKGIEMIHNTPVYRLRGKLLSLVYLNQELQLSDQASQATQERQGAINIVVLQAEDQNFGLVVEEIIDTEEVVVKPLSKQLKHLSAFAGATIMGDGKIALILDVLGLAERAGVLSEEARARTKADKSTQPNTTELQTLLLFKAGQNRRLAIPLSMVSRLEEIPTANVEWAGDQELVQYRGHLMPLIQLSRVLSVGGYQSDPGQEFMQVVVCGQNGSTVGLVVDEIVDVVEEQVSLQSRKRQDSILGVAVIQGKVTELLNVKRIIGAADVALFEHDETTEVI